MDKSLYPATGAAIARKRKELAPQPLAAFKAFSESVFADGALPARTKQLIAVAVAHVTQCPYCIRGHTAAAMKSGATGQEIMEAIWVAAEMRAGAAYAHSALALDKIRTKQVWSSIGLPTPRWLRLPKGGDVHAAARELGLPLIVKPSLEGSSVGVSRVFDDAGLDAAIELAQRYPGELLMEQLIEPGEGVGGEFTIGVLDGHALATIHIMPAGEYYDYNAKYVADDTRYICPGLDEAGEAQARAMAETAFAAIGPSSGKNGSSLPSKPSEYEPSSAVSSPMSWRSRSL